MIRLATAVLASVMVLAGLPPLAFAQGEAPKDPTAMSVLAQMSGVTGWSRLNAPADIVATGTVTRYREGVKVPAAFTVKARGGRQSRFEVQDGSSLRTTIVNNHRGAVLDSNGTRFIPSHAALSLRPMVFPFLGDLVAADDGDVAVRYLGMEDVRGEATHRIEVAREPRPNRSRRQVQRRAAQLIVWVSASTYLPVQIEYSRIAANNPSALQRRTRYLSDYQVVSGLLVPFRQEDSANGKPLYTLELNQVQFNVGVPDSDFDVPGGQG